MAKSKAVKIGDAHADLYAAAGQLNGAIEELDKLGERVELRIDFAPSSVSSSRVIPHLHAEVPRA